ncbi:MAG: NADH-quinone oxidoreductase subunit NuoH [Elusimicrobia bacterium]|nr:NADH-quinone oxidoreductase subunit NuoH [Elusimicrobiota bacterium]
MTDPVNDKPEEKPAESAPTNNPATTPSPAVAGPAAPAAAAVPKPAPKPKVVIPDPVFNEKNGILLKNTRYWPTELWKNPWSRPGYALSAGILAGILITIFGGGALIGELSYWGDKLYRILYGADFPKFLLAGPAVHLSLPPMVAEGLWIAIKLLIVLHIVLINGLWAIWWERKISAHMQSRLGPVYSGNLVEGWNFHGWAQTLVDGIKLLLKEDITPAAADSWIHALAPGIVVAPVIIAFTPVSFGKDLAAANVDIGTLYIFAVSGISVIGIVMAGWASGNKYSLLGGLRSAAQIVSYELPRGFAVVPVIMFAGSLDLAVISQAQAGYWHGLPKWYLFYPVVGQLAFVIFLIASVAETNRVPFDIAEAESELVAGFHTEYSGMKWSIFFLTEYGYVLLASFLLATFFMGGGASPFFFDHWVPSWIWMLAKAMLMMFVFIWFRWTFPRFRVDQLMDFNWKFLLPWSFANIALAGVYLLFLAP